MMAGASPSWWWTAPALRFLALFLLTWVGVRMAAPFYEGQDRRLVLAATPVGAPSMVAAAPTKAPFTLAEVVEQAGPWPIAGEDRAAVVRRFGAGEKLRSNSLPNRETPQLAVADMALSAVVFEAVEPAVVAVSRRDAMAEVEPIVAAEKHQPTRVSGRAGWSLSAWALVREKAAMQQRRVFAGELAGSQLGARLAYGLGEQGAVQIYGRASAALYHLEQSEAAVGVSYRPLAALPLDVAVERRQKLGADGRNATALMLVGGVSGRPLPLGFQWDAYAQAGVVGLRSKDGFVDGALVIDRSLQGGRSPTAARFGFIVAGAAQPELSRLDVGPRMTLPLPKLGQGMRVALDYRSRILGNAEPKNGPALTIGMDF